jgi:hypothetical protein
MKKINTLITRTLLLTSFVLVLTCCTKPRADQGRSQDTTELPPNFGTNENSERMDSLNAAKDTTQRMDSIR